VTRAPVTRTGDRGRTVDAVRSRLVAGVVNTTPLLGVVCSPDGAVRAQTAR
jgi:hypothetical protein